MQKKTILLGTFTKPNFVDSVIDRLNTKFNLEEKDIFFFETEHDDVFMTYRMEIERGERFDIKKDLRKTIQVHKKGSTFFTINGMAFALSFEVNTLVPIWSLLFAFSILSLRFLILLRVA